MLTVGKHCLSSLPYQYISTVKPFLSQTSLGPTFMLIINRSLVYTGVIYKDFLHWEYNQCSVYTGFQHIQGSVESLHNNSFIIHKTSKIRPNKINNLFLKLSLKVSNTCIATPSIILTSIKQLNIKNKNTLIM